MAVELPVVIGIGFISAFFAYYAIRLRAEDDGGDGGGFGGKLSLFFFILSLLFANLLFYAITLMVQNDATVAYLESPIINVGLLIMTYATIGLFIIFVIWILIQSVVSLYGVVMEALGKRGRDQ